MVPMPGTRRKERLFENFGRTAVDLSESDLTEISNAIPAGSAAGARYPEA